MENLSFQQKSSSVGPVANGERDDLSIGRRAIGLDSGKRTWPGDTRCAHITEFVAHAGIEIRRGQCGLPSSVGGAGMLIFARNISYVLYFKSLDRATHVELGPAFHGVPDAHIRHFGCGLIL